MAMTQQAYSTASHATFSLRYHLVMVTKYRRKALSEEMLREAETIFGEVLGKWRCGLLEFGGDADHVHLLIEAHPALELSRLVNNLKTASSRRLRNRYPEHLANFYSKPVLWHRAYFVSSVGSASLGTVKDYIEAQRVDEGSERGGEPPPPQLTGQR